MLLGECTESSLIAGGSILMFTIVSDLNRDHECAGGHARCIDNMPMQDGSGTIWRRVQ